MTPHFSDDWLTVYAGDCRDVLPTLAAESVDCIVTSPPYWGLRDYGTEGQLGLEATPELYVANLVAVFRELRRVLKGSGTCWLNLGSSYAGSGKGGNPEDSPWSGYVGSAGRENAAKVRLDASGDIGPIQSRQLARAPAYGSDGTRPSDSWAPGSAYPDLCGECQAALSSRTTDTSRLLPDDAQLPSQTARDSEPPGSGLAPLGASPLDVQASTTPRSEQLPPGQCSHCGNCGACLSVLRSSSRDARACARSSWLNYPTFKPKDMVPIPWMVAMALQADGWYLRSDIIWSKPNPMPESVTDRPTKAHEYLFLLTKSARYYYDADAVREATITPPQSLNGQPRVGRVAYEGKGNPEERSFSGDATFLGLPAAGRNLRSVWTIATRPYPGAHFAVFPPELPERCIKAGSSERGVCPECGAPWERMVERTGADMAARYERGEPTRHGIDGAAVSKASNVGAFTGIRATREWIPTCDHLQCSCQWEGGGWADFPHKSDCPVVGYQTAPAVILDPFAGSGTVGLVANRLSRRAILIDLNPDYISQQMKRNAQTPLGLPA